MRTALMMLGIVVGISSLAILSSVGEATKRETMQRFKNMLGTFDTIIVRPGGGRSRGMPTLVNVPPTLRFEDSNAIATELPEIKTVAEVQNAFDIDVQYRDQTTSPAVFGVSANWLALRSEAVADGSFFTDEQNASLSRVAVLGTDVRNNLFPDEDPLGKTIRIANVPFQVIGLLKPRGVGPAGGALDNIVLIPINTAARRVFNRDFLTMLIAQIKDPDRSTETTEKVAALLREHHHIRPPALDDFTITSPAATMAQVRRAGSTLGKILTGVSIMALLIGWEHTRQDPHRRFHNGTAHRRNCNHGLNVDCGIGAVEGDRHSAVGRRCSRRRCAAISAGSDSGCTGRRCRRRLDRHRRNANGRSDDAIAAGAAVASRRRRDSSLSYGWRTVWHVSRLESIARRSDPGAAFVSFACALGRSSSDRYVCSGDIHFALRS